MQIAIYCKRRHIGWIGITLDGWPDDPDPVYRFSRAMPRRRTSIPVTARTIRLAGGGYALEVDDEAALAPFPTFRLVRDRDHG